MSISHARRRKTKRAVALQAVAKGRLPLREVILDSYAALGTCPIYRILVSAPGLGDEGMRKTLERAQVWPFTPLGELSEMQRQAVVDHLPTRIK
jgi:hypothetical protein